MSYTPNTWQNGDIISAEKLNHIEEGIAEGGGVRTMTWTYYSGSPDYLTCDWTLDQMQAYYTNPDSFLMAKVIVPQNGTYYLPISDIYNNRIRGLCNTFLLTVYFDNPQRLELSGDINGIYNYDSSNQHWNHQNTEPI